MMDDEPGPAEPRRSARQIQDDVDEELRFHLELRAAELEAAGLDPAAAREEAARRFGDVMETQRACVASDRERERTLRRREYVAELVQDLAHGLRQLRARPLFALATIVTLALGIGATTAIFGAADHVLFRPLPYRAIDRVVTLWELDRSGSASKRPVSPGNFVNWADRTTSFAAIGLAEPSGSDLTGDGPPEPVASWRVTRGFFAALGVTPLLGRAFLAEEFEARAAPAVLISYGLWQRRFAANPAIVGRTIDVDGAKATVVGVLPRDLEYPGRKDLWVPKRFRPDELSDRRSSYMYAVARLRPGVSLVQARADLARVAGQLAQEFPRTNALLGVQALPLEEQVLGRVRPAFLILLGAVILLLLIGCANVAGLQLARGAARETELALRSALGAPRERLVRQLLTESLLLAGLGGLAGIALAWFGTQALVALGPPRLPRLDSIAIDARVLGFALGATLASALMFGLFPALRFSRPELLPALGSGGRSSAGKTRTRLRNGLVVAEIALALVLLTGAGLLMRSFFELTANDVGFESRGRVSLQLFLWDRNPQPAQRLQRVDELSARFLTVPGVEAVGLVSAMPFHPSQIDAHNALTIEGRPTLDTEAEAQVYTTVASPEYFRIMVVPLLQGRPFAASDRMDAPRVALINRALARRFFPGEDPVGKRVSVGVMSAPETREIIGVVGDVRPTTLDSDPRPELFIPYAQSATGSVTFVIRTQGDPAAQVPVLRKKLWEIDPEQSIYHAATVQSLISNTLVERRFNLVLLAVFSLIALVLAGIGIFSLISFTTGQRTHEIGVRIALGARPRDIAGMILRDGLKLIGPGVALGIGGALALTRVLAQMLYNVRPTDPATFAEVGVLMGLVAMVGAMIPAARAALTDPMRALRQE
jgi:predicted permease